MQLSRISLGVKVFCACAITTIVAGTNAHAGISLELRAFHDSERGTYTLAPDLSTNSKTPVSAIETFDQVSSPASNFAGGLGAGASFSSSSYTNFTTFLNAVTNGTWQLIINSGAANQTNYTFKVTSSGLTSNSFGSVSVTFPTNETTITNALPKFTWKGETTWDSLDVSLQNGNPDFLQAATLAISQTSSTLPPALTNSSYAFTVDYSKDISTSLKISTPVNASQKTLSGWESSAEVDATAQSSFSVLLPGTITLGEALGATNLPWSTGGNGNWFSETNVTFNGGRAAAEVSSLDFGQVSSVSTTVQGSATVSFEWRIANADSNFSLAFIIDGAVTNVLTGNSPDWTSPGTVTLGPGAHALQWVASVADSGVGAPLNDAGWLADVNVEPIFNLICANSPVAGNEPLTVQFSAATQDSGGHSVMNYAWNFGDGAVSSAQNPTHQYTTLGKFTPALVAMTSMGAPANVLGLSSVTVTNPSITVSASPHYGVGPLTVQFTSPSADDAGDQIVQWNWEFGDGASSILQNPIHTFTNAGQYEPSLTAYGANVPLPLIVNGPASVSVLQTAASIKSNLVGLVTSFVFDNFANRASLQLNGNATTVSTTNGPILQLTAAQPSEAGSAFLATPVPLDSSLGFSTVFMFRLSPNPGATPADGIVFTIQTQGPFALGDVGGDLGYGAAGGGISPSVAVEFDTYDNGTDFGIPGDINGNHVAINTNGYVNDPYSSAVTNGTLSDGNIWYAWIDYDGIAKDLEVRVSQQPSRPPFATLSASIDLFAILGNTNVFVGFTGATGNFFEEQDVLAWKFSSMPTTRFTADFALTNLPNGFGIKDGVLLEKYKYTLAGTIFTNFVYCPLTVTNSGSAQFTASTILSDLVPDALGNSINAILAGDNDATTGNAVLASKTLESDAGSLDTTNFASFALLSTYTNLSYQISNTNGLGEGAFIAIQQPELTSEAQGATFSDLFGLSEQSYETFADQLSSSAPLGLFGTESASGDDLWQLVDIANDGLWISMDSAQNAAGNAVLFSDGLLAGAITLRQQIITSAEQAIILTGQKTNSLNFSISFSTVYNKPYTVWSNSAVAALSWNSYTNLVGTGYFETITLPVTGHDALFLRVSSP